ncbi:hypothetical protein E2562_013470 [Oryza meyeriana var. granulata]|uniref:Uncharacterized protein n=1 Tax=Oryza meyeriana var. granulata TaxID=110450 RepID=A0A6G1BUQ0_9ORYZ|nr:hypothetical protein E2562_013470 [Oryza meyeriana var. granulata]
MVADLGAPRGGNSPWSQLPGVADLVTTVTTRMARNMPAEERRREWSLPTGDGPQRSAGAGGRRRCCGRGGSPRRGPPRRRRLLGGEERKMSGDSEKQRRDELRKMSGGYERRTWTERSERGRWGGEKKIRMGRERRSGWGT